MNIFYRQIKYTKMYFNSVQLKSKGAIFIKKTMTQNRITIAIIFFIVFSLQSCVSKKKYLAIEKLKFEAETKIKDLNKSIESNQNRISVMISDFEEMKYELLKSNAVKDALVDSISGELNKLTKEVSRKENALDSKQFSFEFERNSLNNKISELKSQINNKNTELETLKRELGAINENMSQLTFDLNREKGEKRNLHDQINLKETKIMEITTLSEKLSNEISLLKKQINEKNETINRLENNVKLLKKEIK